MRKATKSPGEKIVKDIKRATRKHYSSEEKIRIVLDGLRGEDSIAELCRREGISQGIYYKWSKDFMEAGKKRLAGDTARAANTEERKARQTNRLDEKHGVDSARVQRATSRSQTRLRQSLATRLGFLPQCRHAFHAALHASCRARQVTARILQAPAKANLGTAEFQKCAIVSICAPKMSAADSLHAESLLRNGRIDFGQTFSTPN